MASRLESLRATYTVDPGDPYLVWQIVYNPLVEHVTVLDLTITLNILWPHGWSFFELLIFRTLVIRMANSLQSI